MKAIQQRVLNADQEVEELKKDGEIFQILIDKFCFF